MNKKHALACAISAAAALASQACHAQSQVQIYGTVDAAVGTIETQPVGAPNAAIVKITGVHSGGLQTSYWGFRGSEDLGGGMSAKFQLEGFFRADTGLSGRFDATPGGGADPMFSRETFVGLAGAFGEVRLGTNGHPTWVSMIQTNALGANSVFSPSFRQLFNAGTRGAVEVDTALVNSVKYITPKFGGAEGSIAYQAVEGGVGKSTYSANLVYRGGPLVLTAAYSSIGHAAPPALPAARDQTVYLLGGAYNFGPARVFGQYTGITNDRLATKDKVPHFGVTVPLGSGEVQFSTGQNKRSGPVALTFDRKTTSLGYVYNMSKRTDLYTFAMADKVSVGTASSFVVGIRHRF